MEWAPLIVFAGCLVGFLALLSVFLSQPGMRDPARELRAPSHKKRNTRQQHVSPSTTAGKDRSGSAEDAYEGDYDSSLSSAKGPKKAKHLEEADVETHNSFSELDTVNVAANASSSSSSLLVQHPRKAASPMMPRIDVASAVSVGGASSPSPLTSPATKVVAPAKKMLGVGVPVKKSGSTPSLITPTLPEASVEEDQGWEAAKKEKEGGGEKLRKKVDELERQLTVTRESLEGYKERLRETRMELAVKTKTYAAEEKALNERILGYSMQLDNARKLAVDNESETGKMSKALAEAMQRIAELEKRTAAMTTTSNSSEEKKTSAAVDVAAAVAGNNTSATAAATTEILSLIAELESSATQLNKTLHS